MLNPLKCIAPCYASAADLFLHTGIHSELKRQYCNQSILSDEKWSPRNVKKFTSPQIRIYKMVNGGKKCMTRIKITMSHFYIVQESKYEMKFANYTLNKNNTFIQLVCINNDKRNGATVQANPFSCRLLILVDKYL